MNKEINKFHFALEVTIPKDEDHTWARNIQYNIVARTAENAIKALREAAPTAVIHVVRKVGAYDYNLIVADD